MRPFPAHAGHTISAAIVVGTFVLCLGGLGIVAYFAIPLVTAVAVLVLLLNRQWYSYLVLTAWMWLLSAFLRRVVDWSTVYHDSSVVLLAPALAGLIGIPFALRFRRRVDRTIGLVFGLAAAAFLFGALVGLVRNGPLPVALDVLAAVGPFGAGLFALLVPEDPARLRRTALEIAFWGTVVIGVYGIVQFFVVPAWDAQWVVDSGIQTNGRPEPLHLRVFSTLNTANPFGEVVAATLLVSLAERRPARRMLALVAGLLSLGLSLVRTAWVASIAALLALLKSGRLRVVQVLGVATIGALALVLFGGPVASSVLERFDQSVSSGSNDFSLQQRIAFQTSIAGPTLADPIGAGMGSTGTALKLTKGAAGDPRLGNFDSGIFENATTYGSVFGLAMLIALVVANVSAYRRALYAPPVVAYSAAAVTMLLVSMAFTNTLKNASGFLLWFLLAVAARSWRPRETARSAARATSPS